MFLIQALQFFRNCCPHDIATYQEAHADLKKYIKDCEAISQAFALVAEHGVKTLNRFKAIVEGP